MNTLSKAITGTYFFDEDQENYNRLCKRWKELANDKDKKHLLTHRTHILYQVLRGKDWRKSVSISTKPKRLKNGYIPKFFQVFNRGTSVEYYFERTFAPLFGDLFTLQQIKTAENIMNISKDWGNFKNIDAYKDLE